MPRITATPPKESVKKQAAAAEEKYVNQAAQPKSPDRALKPAKTSSINKDR